MLSKYRSNLLKLSTIKWKNLVQFYGIQHQFNFAQPAPSYPQRSLPVDTKELRRIAENRSLHQTPQLKNRNTNNLYSILGLHRNATLDEIKNAYYVLAKIYHPDATSTDKTTSNSKKFQEIAEAYRVLSDENKRMEYDLNGMLKTSKPPYPRIAENNCDQDLLKIFDEAGYQRNDPKFDEKPIEIPEDLSINVTFLQSVQGTTREVTIRALAKCPRCNILLDSKPNTGMEMCRTCKGSGLRTNIARSNIVHGPCSTCNGLRYVPQNKCSECRGQGYVKQDTTLKIPIPAGVNNRDILHIPHPNLQNKSLAVKLNVVKSDIFTRVGYDIYSYCNISLSMAVLGGVQRIKGIHSDIDLKIDAGMESNTKIRLTGKGVKMNRSNGDHIVTVRVVMPKKLTSKQRALIAAFAKIENSTSDGLEDGRLWRIKKELNNLHKLNYDDPPMPSEKKNSKMSTLKKLFFY